MLRRSKVIEAVSSLPPTFTMEKLIERLIVLKKIEVRLEQANNGQTRISQGDQIQIKKWLK
jgi:hypothetical protein